MRSLIIVAELTPLLAWKKWVINHVCQNNYYDLNIIVWYLVTKLHHETLTNSAREGLPWVDIGWRPVDKYHNLKTDHYTVYWPTNFELNFFLLKHIQYFRIIDYICHGRLITVSSQSVEKVSFAPLTLLRYFLVEAIRKTSQKLSPGKYIHIWNAFLPTSILQSFFIFIITLCIAC